MKQARYEIEYRNKIPYSAEIANEILNKHFLSEDGEFFLESAHRVRLGAPSRKYLFLINGAPRRTLWRCNPLFVGGDFFPDSSALCGGGGLKLQTAPGAHFSHAKHVALNHFCHLPAQKGSSKSRKTTSCRINPATTMRLNRLFP